MKIYDYGGWYFPAPPVCTSWWTPGAWDKYIESYRPRGYYGAYYDRSAWIQFASACNNQAVIDEYVASWPGIFNQEF